MIYKSIQQYNWKGKTVLIAEDDHASIFFLQEILKSTGIEILVTDTGQKTLKACRENKKIDLVLMDMSLPDLDGFEVTRKIKKMRKNLPVIATTAYALLEDRERCYECGCDDYISKPINIFELISKMDRLLVTA